MRCLRLQPEGCSKNDLAKREGSHLEFGGGGGRTFSSGVSGFPLSDGRRDGIQKPLELFSHLFKILFAWQILMPPTITITGSRTGKSISVVYNGGLYKNVRPPHVETHENPTAGAIFHLTKREERETTKGNIAVMYTVNGLKNGRFEAHITVYHGPLVHGTHKHY